MENTMKFEKVSLAGRVKSMLKVDFRRMFKSKLFYILIACALVIICHLQRRIGCVSQCDGKQE